MPHLVKDLWSLALDRPQVDAGDLAQAIVDQVQSQDLDYRTRLLIHDGMAALSSHWGEDRFARWLDGCSVREKLLSIGREDPEETGFPSLRRRIVETTRPEQIKSFFRDLGTRLRRPVTLHVGGSVALILTGYLSRRTEDVDVVDEVPAEIRSDHALLADLDQVHMLHLGHFQSHYLPSGWQNRVHSIEQFGQLRVYLVDAHDVFLSKLCSSRTKDRADLQTLFPLLDRETLMRRLCETTQSMFSAPDLRQRAEQNWYVLTGEALPS